MGPASSTSRHSRSQTLTDQWVIPTYQRLPITLVRGRGPYVWDEEGKKYLDFISGIAVANLGHAPRAIAQAISTQAKKLIHCSNLFYVDGQGELAESLTRLTGLEGVFFCNSGTEAVETAIKLARYFGVKKNPDRYEIIATENSFHGRTCGSLSATGQERYRVGFGPLLAGFSHVPFGNLEAMATAITPATCAVLVEPIQAEGGVVIPDKSYLSGLRKLTKDKGILLIVDEVQTAMGRTGKFLACEHSGVVPDIIAMAKGLGSGFPVGACLVSREVSSVCKPGLHASTFGGNPVACRAALATLKIIGKKSFLTGVVEKGNFFLDQLDSLKKKYPVIVSVRGMGLLTAFTLSDEVGVPLQSRCLEKGLLVNVIQGKIIRLIPPLTISKKEILSAVKIIDSVLGEMEGYKR